MLAMVRGPAGPTGSRHPTADGVIIVAHISVKVIRDITVPEFIYVGVGIVHVDVVGHTQVHTVHGEVAIVRVVVIHALVIRT